MAEVIRVPISNMLTGDNFTMSLSVGALPQLIHVLLDTGSSTLVVDRAIYDPTGDTAVATTQLLVTETFATGEFHAAVVRTPVGLVTSPGTPPVTTLADTNLAVTYDSSPGTFGQADGVFGLAYTSLNKGLRMPADTWENKYTEEQLSLGQPANIAPFVEQLVAAQFITNKFAFSVQRSTARQALPEPESDPLNHGLFVLGGGAECTDLYTGALTSVAVVHEKYYNTNLIAIEAGDQSIEIAPIVPNNQATSNSIIDSGSTNVTLDQGVYERLLTLIRSVNPALAPTLQAYSNARSNGFSQDDVGLAQWPILSFIMQGSDGGRVTIAVEPKDYWQFDTNRAGNASLMVIGDGGMLHGQSILGLPLFANRFIVFDRSTANGVIGFAPRAQNTLIS